jgi:hypothetical protein
VTTGASLEGVDELRSTGATSPVPQATSTQAHFGHEFREFTGLTPTRYVEVRRRFLREHPGHVLDGWPLPAD